MLTTEELSSRAAMRIAELGEAMAGQIPELTAQMQRRLAQSVDPLEGDEPLQQLRNASIESNLENLVQIMRYGLPVADASAPTAAVEYARRLAQREISSTALMRAYRLGQELVVEWVFKEFNRLELDPEVALATGRQLVEITFRYVDAISELVVDVYETERERWLSHRSTVRAAMIENLLAGGHPPVAVAEQALGYRLHQRHLGVVLWGDGRDVPAQELPYLERTLTAAATALAAVGPSLFFPRERSLAWGWIPLGRGGDAMPDLRALESALERTGPDLRVAVGTPLAGVEGFRVTHLEALRAHRVATVANSNARRLTSYADAGVRTAAMLALDPESTRRLVTKALGLLAADNERAERLRDTLLTFLSETGSYTATSQRVHVHKNTVKYRIDRAIEERGRPLDDERLELELALIACRWLGSSVLNHE